LHLDGDLYESTQVCLEWLYPQVSPGAIVIVDDYGMRGCRDALEEYFQPRGSMPDLYQWSDYGAMAFIKP
jgi:O-methyltransferase